MSIYTQDFLKELIAVGVVTVVLGLAITWIVMKLTKNEKPPGKDHWGYCALIFFLTGTVAHFVFEVAGWNKWYCKHGNACKSA
jgi:hypothetical protein